MPKVMVTVVLDMPFCQQVSDDRYQSCSEVLHVWMEQLHMMGSNLPLNRTREMVETKIANNIIKPESGLANSPRC